MSTEDILNSVSHKFHIYFGLPVVILGVIGGIFNIIIFTTLKTFRETTCAFYLTAVSLVNIGQLLTTLLVRVLSEGFNTDLRRISWVCKIQIYMAAWCTCVSFTSICLATIDQCLSMSKYRRFSTLRFAQCCIGVTCVFWSLYGIVFLIYSNAPSGTCMIVNPYVARYVSGFHFPILLGLLPISIMITFSLLAFYNARTLISRQGNIVRLSRDRQLTAITLVHVVSVVILTLPYTIFFIYLRNQYTTDAEIIARNNLITAITRLVNYSSFAVSILFENKLKENFFYRLRFTSIVVFLNDFENNLSM